MEPHRRETAGRGPAEIRVDLPLCLRAPQQREGPLAYPTHGVSAQAFSIALENFARVVGAGKKKSIVLVVDKAAWHTAKKDLELPEGIHLEYLPSHCPELQPSERPWPLSNEG
jgi:DDE superfamily endonuclease